VPTWPQPDPQWIEDRFWVWIHYGATKLGRGELFECLDVLAALRAMVFGPLIARDGGHRAAGVRRLEQMAPGLVPAREATVGDHTAPGCAAALRASAALYRQLRGDAPALVRRTSAEAASLDYLAQIEAVPVHSHGRGSGDIGCGQGRERADAGCEDQAAGDDEDQADRVERDAGEGGAEAAQDGTGQPAGDDHRDMDASWLTGMNTAITRPMYSRGAASRSSGATAVFSMAIGMA
jgi:hypothetical protein